MRARRRSPGDGVRSNSLGIGLGSGRFSPEKPSRGHGMYSSEYRGFNRGFGRGPPKPYIPPPQPRRGDIFMEAGRLAAEYLVSKGVIPANSLPEKWPNGSGKGHNGDFQEFRAQDRENPAPEGRTSALARLGNVVPDAGSGRDEDLWQRRLGNSDFPFPARRRFVDEFNSMGPRTQLRGRRRMCYGRGFGSDWSRENGRSGPWLDKGRVFPEMAESEDDQGDKRVGTNVGGAPKVADELPSKGETVCDSESDLENLAFPDDSGSRASSYTTRKDQAGLDVDLNKGYDPETFANVGKDAIDLNLDGGEFWDGICSDDGETKNVSENLMKQQGLTDEDHLRKQSSSNQGEPSSGNDLRSLCGLAKVPTKTRSSLRFRGSKIDQCLTDDLVPPKGFKVSTEDDSLEGSSSDSQTYRNQSSGFIPSEISRIPSVRSMGEVGQFDPAFDVEKESCRRSQSFSGRSFTNEQESSRCPPGFGDSETASHIYGRCRSMVQRRDKESFGQHMGLQEGTKRPRDWDSLRISQADEYFQLHDLKAHQPGSQVERLSPDEEMVEAIEQERLGDEEEANAMLASKISSHDIEMSEEKQFFPNPFQICDVDHPDTFGRTEHSDDLIPSQSSAPFSALEVEREASTSLNLLLNFGLSRGEHGAVLGDALDGSLVDEGVFSTDFQDLFNRFPLLKNLYHSREIMTGLNCLVCLASRRKTETVYPSLQSLLNHTENADDLPKVHKRYGLAIYKLFGTDLLQCSSETVIVNDPCSDMPLVNDEGMPGDEDGIFVSLEEMPIRMPEI